MSDINLMEVGIAALREAKLVIMIEGCDVSCQWLNAQGEQVAHGLGYPAQCVNSPSREKCKLVHFDVYWQKVLGLGSYRDVKMEHYEVSNRLGAWLNQESVTAALCESIGGTHITVGFWHTQENRWMWGPKIPRREFQRPQDLMKRLR